MPRFEINAQEGRRFWEIWVVDRAIWVRYGRVGTDGRSQSPRVFASADKAWAEAQKRIADKRKDGYEPVDDDIGEHAHHPELVEAILDNPGDDGTYLVYADWLQSQGDARGELIILEHGLARKQHDARLLRAKRAFDKKHGRRMLPSRIAEVCRSTGESRGAEECAVDWRLGFIDSARVSRADQYPPYTVRELIAALLTHPSAQLIRALTIGAVAPEPPYDYEPVIETLCNLAPASLRVLKLAAITWNNTATSDIRLGDLGRLWERLPRLEELSLRAGSVNLGAIRAPTLQRFVLDSAGPSWENLHAIATAQCPRLEELRIVAGEQTLAVDGLEPLLDGHGPSMPALHHLSLTHTSHTRDLWRALARSSLLRQLEVLDLSHGDLSDGDVSELLSVSEGFRHLRLLELSGNYISRPLRGRVRELCADVRLDGQRGVAADMPPITEEMIIEWAPDARSYLAAGDVAQPEHWPRLASWMTMLWGQCQGSQVYDVFVDLAQREAGCTCPSYKYPCKHVLGLLRIAARGRPLPVQPPPPGFIDGCRRINR